MRQIAAVGLRIIGDRAFTAGQRRTWRSIGGAGLGRACRGAAVISWMELEACHLECRLDRERRLRRTRSPAMGVEAGPWQRSELHLLRAGSDTSSWRHGHLWHSSWCIRFLHH